MAIRAPDGAKNKDNDNDTGPEGHTCNYCWQLTNDYGVGHFYWQRIKCFGIDHSGSLR